MHYKDIVKKSWQLTHEKHSELFTFAFVPNLFAVIIGIIYITYQIFAFRYSHFFSQDKSIDYLSLLNNIFDFISQNHATSAIILIISFIILLMYFLSPIICGAALIDLITKIIFNKPVKGGLSAGFSSFFPLFEFATLTSVFSITTFFTEISMILRNFDPGSWVIIIPFLSFVFIIGLFLHILFIFSQQFIVLEKANVIQALKKSSMLVLCNVKDIVFLGITIALITARIFINIFLIFLIPIIFISLVAILTTFLSKIISLIIAIIIGVVLIIIASYLMSGFNIFMYCLWTISFILFRRREEKDKLSETDLHS